MNPDVSALLTASRVSVLQVATGLPGWGGTERHILTLTGALARLGHDAVIACQRESWLWVEANRRGIPTAEATVRHTLDCRAVPSIRSIVRHASFDVVHTHGYRDYIVPALAARLAGAPCVVNTRHLVSSFRTRFRALTCSLLFYDRMIAVSRAVRDALVRSGASAGRVRVIPNGVDLEAFALAGSLRGQVRRTLGLDDSTFVVGSIGRLTPVKGHRYLLQCMAGLPKRSNVACLLVGDGPCRDSLAQQAAAIGIGDRVHFLGYREDIPSVLSAMDAVVVCSVIPEAHPLAAIEGLASGKPVVGFDMGGLPEIVQHGVTGLLTAPNDAHALTCAIQALSSSPDRGRTMGEVGRHSVRHLGVERMAGATADLYLEVLRSRSRLTRRQCV